MEYLDKLHDAVLNGDPATAITITEQALDENIDPHLLINDYMIRAMDEVGARFERFEYFIPQLLMSAKAMKGAMALIRPLLVGDGVGDSAICAITGTVKGDVHDIGKNLVQIILSNNGYNVIDLGIKCPPETMIQAAKEHNPDIIGMSGLLVKSAQQMVGTVKDFKAAGMSVPVIVGGAALTQKFTSNKIQPDYDGLVVYAKDAMKGLDIINQLLDKEKCDEFIANYRKTFKPGYSDSENNKKETKALPIKEKNIPFDYDIKSITMKNYTPQLITSSFDDLWTYINRQMLYGHHLGLKGNMKKLFDTNDPKAMKLDRQIQDVKQAIIDKNHCKPKGVYQFFKVKKEDTTMVILSDDEQTELQRFDFPRQPAGYQYCLTDFIHPEEVDTICFFVVTSGQEILEYAKELKAQEKFLASHIANAIGLETAEAFAEYLHQHIRSEWGFQDDPSWDMDDVFKLKYQGRRYSFGYPACPDLGYQRLLWDILSPDKQIGVTLCDDFMMEPDGSVSALVLHHPKATYFRVSE